MCKAPGDPHKLCGRMVNLEFEHDSESSGQGTQQTSSRQLSYQVLEREKVSQIDQGTHLKTN
jgi:hypothetical protein